MAAWLSPLQRPPRARCFFCHTPAGVGARDNSWVCGACGESNSPSRMAGLLSPSASSSLIQPRQQSSGWTPRQSQPSPFCPTCLRNHQIVSALLADFDPPDDPDLAHQAAATYRAQLEASYPPVCAACAPRVQQAIAANTRRAKTALFASALQRPDRPVPVRSPGAGVTLLSWARVAVQGFPLVLTSVWLAGLSRLVYATIQTPLPPLSLIIAVQYFAVLAGPGGMARRFVAAFAAVVQTLLLSSPQALQVYTRWVLPESSLYYETIRRAPPASAWFSDSSDLPPGLKWVVIVAAGVQLWALTSPSNAPPPRPVPQLVAHPPQPADPVLPPAPPKDPLLDAWGLSNDAPADPDDTMDWEPEPVVRRRRPEPLVRPQTYFPPGTLQAQQTGLEDLFGRAVALQDPPAPAPRSRYPVLIAVASAFVLMVVVLASVPARSKDK